MDSLVKRFDCKPDADLMLCEHRGVAYQSDMHLRVPYDDAYFQKVMAYEGTDIAKRVNVGRCAMLARHLPQSASVLDIGAGTGAFVHEANAAGFDAKGFEVMRQGADLLRDASLYADDPAQFDAVTMWDSIEHMEMPEHRLLTVRKGAHLFVSVPVFDSLHTIRESKHYRPGEHLYYWTRQGFIDWIGLYGFRLLEESAHEVEAGRERIGAFAFIKDLPDYSDHIGAYKSMHSTRYYGASATELHLRDVALLVRKHNPRSILDYGCGRSDIAAHFWRDGQRKIARFDPAIPQFEMVPDGRFDMVLCLDVMEHIPMACVDQTFAQIKSKTGRFVFFTISTKPARAKLPDGRNAHVTLLTKSEWMRWIKDVFRQATELPSKWEHELMIFVS